MKFSHLKMQMKEISLAYQFPQNVNIVFVIPNSRILFQFNNVMDFLYFQFKEETHSIFCDAYSEIK